MILGSLLRIDIVRNAQLIPCNSICVQKRQIQVNA
jgi:hypothetical protein